MAIGNIKTEADLERFIQSRLPPQQRASFVPLDGHGDPTGVVDAPIGSDYRDLDGGAGTTLYVQEGPGSSDWAPK